MCGICGWAGRAPDTGRLRRACDAMRHRGPDGGGGWSGERVMLGHRRLSIIDLSHAADQPATNEDGTVRLTFNGEIYNFQPLRRELEGRHRFASASDTEVLVHGYEEWGIEGLLSRIRGMYAFAIWDGARGVLHLARDPLGKKPLFYAVDDGALAFASTLPALLELRDRAVEVDPAAVQDFLLHLCVPGEESIAAGVRKLLPGHRAEFRGGTLSLHRYWRPTFAAQERRSEGEWLEAIEAELSRAVRDRLVSDVPLGVFLSGGVDSSLVTALAVRESSGPVTTVSAGFDEAGFSELEHARRVARHLGTDHHEHVVRPDAAAVLPWLVYAAGEPFGDHALLPAMYLSQAARRHMTVVLGGDGGDEVFAGYPGPLIARLARGYRLVPAALRGSAIPAALARLSARSGAARRLRRLAEPARGPGLDWVYDPLGDRGFRGRLDAVLSPALRRRLQGRDPDAYWRAAFAAADGPTDADRVLETELTTLLPDQFLVKADAATMAYGLEGRSPLLDVGVVELAGRIPAAMKTAGLEPKHLLKRLASRFVPREVLYRKKQGFSVPTGAWLRGPLAPAVRGTLLAERALGRGLTDPGTVRALVADHLEGRADHGQRLWLLLQLELWMRMFVDREVAPGERLEVDATVGAAA